MPLLYETVLRRQRRFQQIFTKRYPIPWPSTMGVGTNVQKMELALPYNATKIHSVSLVVTGTITINVATPLTPVSAQVDFYVNGNLVGARGIGPAIAPTSAPFSVDASILALVHEGWNDFQMTLRQSWSPLGNVSSVSNILGYIELVYSGPEPPAPKSAPPVWWTYAKWGLIGVGAIAFVGLAVPKIVEAVRRK